MYETLKNQGADIVREIIYYLTVSKYASSQRQVFVWSSTSPSSYRMEEYFLFRCHALCLQIDVKTRSQALYLRD